MNKLLLRLSICIGLIAIRGELKAQVGIDDKVPLQGCVKWVCETIYKAEIENGVIGKGALISQNQDTLFYNADGSAIAPDTKFSLKNEKDSLAYQYDNHGRCIKIVVYYPDHHLRESRTLIYNDQGKLKLCIVRSTEEDVVDAISYTYDPYGKLTMKIYNRKDGDMHQQRFAYDEHGNWIIRVDFNDYNPIYYVERQIEYYSD